MIFLLKVFVLSPKTNYPSSQFTFCKWTSSCRKIRPFNK